jgi:hypothetical protein
MIEKDENYFSIINKRVEDLKKNNLQKEIEF